MSTKKAVVYSKYPLVREWLSYSLKKLDWEVAFAEDERDEAGADVAVIEVNEKSDERVIDESNLPVVVFSRLPNPKLIGLLYDFDISGVVRLSSDTETLQESMDAALNGEEYFDEVLIGYLLSDKYRDIHECISSLTRREHDVIKGILDDLSNEEIAVKYRLSIRTVNSHKRNILLRMEERSIVGVIKTILTYALRYS